MAVAKPMDILDACGEIGATRGKTEVVKTMLLSFLAGAYIALGGLLMASVVAGLPKSFGTMTKLVGGALFPVGLMLVVIGGADLFTGNCLYLLIGLVKGRLTPGNMCKSAVLSYLGNLLGSLFVAYLAIASGIFSTEPWMGWIQSLAVAKVQISFSQAFWRGIGCNWLVCMALWLALSSDQLSGKILGIWVSVMAFVTMGFEHSIANMFFIPAGIWVGAHVTWAQFWINNELPVTLGNIVGGGVFVGLIMALCHRKEALLPRLYLQNIRTSEAEQAIAPTSIKERYI